MTDIEDGVLAWAAAELGAPVAVERDLHEGQGPWLLRGSGRLDGRRFVMRAAIAHGKTASYVRTEATALPLAERHRLAAPRLLALDPDGFAAGRTVSLQTVLPGVNLARHQRAREVLPDVGRYLAALHRISVPPDLDLEERRLPLDGDGWRSEHRRARDTPRARAAERLLAVARERTAERPAGPAAPRLVHGDAHLGNLLAHDARCSGLVDWGTAGRGDPGVDLGHLRFTAALLHGLPAAAAVADGWQDASGEAPRSLAYWDLVAALIPPADLGRHTDGRDAFVTDALRRLDR